MTRDEAERKEQEMIAASLVLQALIASAPGSADVASLVQNAAEIGRKLVEAVYGPE